MPEDEPAQFGQPSIFSEGFRKQGYDVRVSACEGYLCKIRLKCLIAMSANEVFDVFTNPDNSNVFRQIDSCDSHEVVSCVDGVKEIHVEQSSTVGFLWFKHRFTTALRVLEDRQKLTMMFNLLRPGVMAAFQGFWTLTDVPITTCQTTNGTRTPTGLCLAYLEQDIAPALVDRAPGWFQGIMRGVCASTVVKLMDDLRLVAALRRRGVSMDVILSSKIRGWGGIKDKYRVPDREDPRPDIELAASALGINLSEPGSQVDELPVNVPDSSSARPTKAGAGKIESSCSQHEAGPSKPSPDQNGAYPAVASFPVGVALDDIKDSDGEGD